MNNPVSNQKNHTLLSTQAPHIQTPDDANSGLKRSSAALGQSYLFVSKKRGICEYKSQIPSFDRPKPESVDEILSKMVAVFSALKNTHKTNLQHAAQEDVKVALRELGGQLLLTAEQSSYNKLNILKTHLESQVNFADQDDTHLMVSASHMYQHLRALQTLLGLMHRDYPDCPPSSAWGPLSEQSIINALKPAQTKDGRPPVQHESTHNN